MTEFITYEIQIAISCRSKGDQSYHLMQRDRAVYNQTFVGSAHLPVHLLVGEPENESLVSNERLVVRFSIADRFLVNPAT